MTDSQREPVDPGLLAETIRLFGMAVEYKGQVFNPAEVVVHTNGVTELTKLQAAWTVLRRWQARPHRGTEANRLYYEMLGALVSGSHEPVIGLEESLGSAPLTPDVAARVAAQAGFDPAPRTVEVTYARAVEVDDECEGQHHRLGRTRPDPRCHAERWVEP